MTTVKPKIFYILPDAEGGVLNYIHSLLDYLPADSFSHHVILTRDASRKCRRSSYEFKGCSQTTFEYDGELDNAFHVVRRLRRLIPDGPGVIIANDAIELAMASDLNSDKYVIQILHGDLAHYYDLAVRYSGAIHQFVAVSEEIKERLTERLPGRKSSISYIRSGVPASANRRSVNKVNSLRLCFVGRLDNLKGVNDLVLIDEELCRRAVPVQWLVVGTGPEESALKSRWTRGRDLTWVDYLSHEQVMQTLARQDLLVFPSRAEGMPLIVLESMSQGVVPIVCDIKSGIPEIIDEGTTGFRFLAGEIQTACDAIEKLHFDRDKLEAVSRAASSRILEVFNIQETAKSFDLLFQKTLSEEMTAPLFSAKVRPFGARLDQPFLPNFLVRFLRKIRTFVK